MGSFPETYDDPKSGGRDLKLARKAQGGNHTIIIIIKYLYSAYTFQF